MAIYIKGNSVPNAQRYILLGRLNGQGDGTYTEYAEQVVSQSGQEINFNLSNLRDSGKLSALKYDFVVQARATDYEDSNYSNVITCNLGTGEITNPNVYTFQISTDTPGAIVTMNSENRSSIQVAPGTSVNWSVSASGYVTQSGTETINGDVIKNVTLVANTPVNPSSYTFTINPTPTSATVTLSATGYSTVSGTGNKSIAVANGTVVNWRVSNTGHVTQSGNHTVTSNYTLPITLTEESGGEIDTSATRLTSYGDNVTAPSRLASKAYIANIQNSFARGTTVSYIEFPVAYSTNKVYYTEGNSVTFPVDVWVFDAATNTPVEQLVDGQNFTTSLSTNDNYTCQTVVVPINRTFNYDFYFGYANVPSSNNIALAYGSLAGNYLSGTEFAIGTPITPGSNYGIPCSIYGTGSTYVAPDDVDDMNQVAYYNETASSVMAGNCYVASKAQTIPANTEIKILDIKAKGDQLTGVNVYVVNANTNIIEEMLLNEATQDTITSTRIDSQVLRLEVNKTYNHPVYFLFNAERSGGSTGMLMKSGVANSILLVDDERKPAVGDDLTDGEWKSGYNIGFAVYN